MAIGAFSSSLSETSSTSTRRGTPTWYLVQRIIAYFNIIWDEAEELARLAQESDPRVVVDTSGLSPSATHFANRLARQITELSEADIAAMREILDRHKAKERRR